MTAALNIVAEIQLRLSRFGFFIFYFLQVLIQKIVCLIYIWLTVKFLTALDWDLFNRVVQEYLWKRIMATGKNGFFCQNSEKQKTKDGPTFSVPSNLLSKYWTIALQYFHPEYSEN